MSESKSSFWTVIITGLAVAGTLIWTLGSGILDKKRETLTNEKILLDIQIHKFTDRRDSLEQVNYHLQDSIRYIRDSLNLKEANLIESLAQNKQLRREKFLVKENCEGMFDYYEGYIDSLIQIRSKSEAIGTRILFGGKAISFGDAGVILLPTGSNN